MNPISWMDTLSRIRVPLGFVFALIFFVTARPSHRSTIQGTIVALAGVLYRAWASGMIRKNAELAASGPYALSRNPLYFGSFLIALGFGWASRRWLMGMALVFFYLLVYVPVMRREERHLENLFGEAYRDYARRVPFFFPWKLWAKRPAARTSFSWRQYWRNREYNALLGFCGAVALLCILNFLRGTE